MLQRIEDPAGLRFSADFGAGEHEFELTRDVDGFVAIPTEGVTPHRLNVTEAEFAWLDLRQVLEQLRDAAGCAGNLEAVANGVFRLGQRTIAGKEIVLLAAPRGVRHLARRESVGLRARQSGVHAKLLLVPDVACVPSADVEEFAAANVALNELGVVPPLSVDWSPLADERFEIPPADPVFFFGERYAVIVDLEQQRIWLEGRELKVKADKQSYRLFAHLAERPKTAVPTKVLANKVLEAEGDRPETKIVSDAKLELTKAIKACLSALDTAPRIDASTLILFEDGRVLLNVDASLVKVIRRLSDS